MSNREVSRTTLEHKMWKVERFGMLDEVVMEEGDIRYHVQVQDMGRPPFLSHWYNEEAPARDFLNKVLSNAQAVVEIGGNGDG